MLMSASCCRKGHATVQEAIQIYDCTRLELLLAAHCLIWSWSYE